MPDLISFDEAIYSLKYAESYGGDVFMVSNNEPYYTLKGALKKILLPSELNYAFALLTIGCYTVAILKTSDGSFRIFDSRNLMGMPCAFGKCILIATHNIQTLQDTSRLFH